MERFHIIDDGCVILRSRGVYKQAKVYRRGDDIYAGWGSGYIKLASHHGTTLPNVSWDAIEAADVRVPMHGAKPVFLPRVERLPDAVRLHAAR